MTEVVDLPSFGPARLAGRTAFVSGANRGIGRALLEALLEREISKIYVGVRNIETMAAVTDPRVEAVQLDISDAASVARAARLAHGTDLLINNAGVAAYVDILRGPVDLIRRDMETNFFGTLGMIRAFTPTMRDRPEPIIVNILSFAAFAHFVELGGYSASKAALYSATQGTRLLLSRDGFRVHSVNAGAVDTDMVASAQIPKTSPRDMAIATLDAVEAGIPDIFPDPEAEAFAAILRTDYFGIEKMLAAFVADKRAREAMRSN